MTVWRLAGFTLVVSAAASLVSPLQGPAHGFFDDSSVVSFTLQAPLQQLFERGRKDNDFSVPARISATDAISPDHAAEAELSVRGNTSRKECEFPKLKMKFKGDHGLFAEVHGVKINTHCGEAPDDELSRDFGRLANERSPWREGVVYRMADAAGARTPRSRPARITYVDTSTPSPRRLTRNALMVEDDGDVKARLGATGEITPDEFTSARQTFSAADTARVAFTQALIGNFDWCLMMAPGDGYRCDARKKLWNMSALKTASGVVPVLQDFDLAGPVTGRHIWFDHAFPHNFSASDVATEVIAQVQRARTLFDRAMLDRLRRDLLLRREAITGAIDGAAVDPRGAELAHAYVDAFYRAIGDDRDFYRPVIAREGIRIFKSAVEDTDACGTGDTAPPGTPLKELRRQNGRAEVQLLDALWRWAPPHECVPAHNGTVWIDPAGISDDFPPAGRR
jgi:hypothetical protein